MAKPLPRQFADDAEMANNYSYSLGTNTPVHRLTQYLVMSDEPAERAEALLSVRDALRGSAQGRENYIMVLEQAQSPTMRQTDPNFGTLVKSSFARDVADGTIGADDVRAIVDWEARSITRRPNQVDKVGDHHDATYNARLSSYVEGLGNDARSVAVRQAFVDASIEKAIALRESSPTQSAALYAQAAEAMSAMTPEQIEANLQSIAKRDGPQGVARFAAGAAAGDADRAAPTVIGGDVGHPELYKADGLATVMNKVNSRIEDGTRAGKPNEAAESLGAQLFNGTTAYLNAARGTDQDRALNDNDARTGLRTAMNNVMQNDFNAILRQNTRPDGEGLEPGAGGGYDALSAYARFQFGAPNDAHGRQTADAAAKILGQKIGTLQGDLLKAERDGGADLRRDFGAGTFGDRAHEQANGAQIVGAMIGATRNGINQDFDVRADRGAHDQKELADKFELAAKVTHYAAKAAGEAAPALEGLSTGLDALSKATPQSITQQSGRGVQYDQMFRQFGDDMAKYRPNQNLANEMQIGYDHSTTEFVRYQTGRQQQKTQDAQAQTQTGLGALLAGRLVPKTDDPAVTRPHQEMSKADVHTHTADAITAYNADKKNPVKLPNAAEVGEWDGKSKLSGVVLKIGDDDYVMSYLNDKKQRAYVHFDSEQIHNQPVVPNKQADLNKDGTLHQQVSGREALGVGSR